MFSDTMEVNIYLSKSEVPTKPWSLLLQEATTEEIGRSDNFIREQGIY